MSKMLKKMLSVHYETCNIFFDPFWSSEFTLPNIGWINDGNSFENGPYQLMVCAKQGSRSASAFVSLRLDLLRIDRCV